MLWMGKVWRNNFIYRKQRSEEERKQKLLLQRALPPLKGELGAPCLCPPPASQIVPFSTVPGLPAVVTAWLGAGVGGRAHSAWGYRLDTFQEDVVGFRHDFGLQKGSCFSNRLHPTVNNMDKHTICFNMKSAQMKCKAWTILNCLCFKTLCLEWCLICIWKNVFFFWQWSLPSHFSFKKQHTIKKLQCLLCGRLE